MRCVNDNLYLEQPTCMDQKMQTSQTLLNRTKKQDDLSVTSYLDNMTLAAFYLLIIDYTMFVKLNVHHYVSFAI